MKKKIIAILCLFLFASGCAKNSVSKTDSPESGSERLLSDACIAVSQESFGEAMMKFTEYYIQERDGNQTTWTKGLEAAVSAGNLDSGESASWNEDLRIVQEFCDNFLNGDSQASQVEVASSGDSSNTIEKSLVSSLRMECNSLPSDFLHFKVQERGTTFNNYGEELVIYGIGSLRIAVYDSGTSWHWGPARSEDMNILDGWNCSYRQMLRSNIYVSIS